MFSREPTSATPAELAELVAQLADEVHERKTDLRRWEKHGTDIPAGTSRFVGRVVELERLGEVLESNHSVGVVTAVGGLGGIAVALGRDGGGGSSGGDGIR